jgi:NAD(P)-dependent dehydrogenase (short-subunit alcohol dehydrogenase family)
VAAIARGAVLTDERSSTMSLHGQHVVVLGGTSGIGLATAQAAAQQGAAVTVVSSNSSNVRRALVVLPGNASGEVADLSDSAQVEAVFERMGELDHLVFTAGEALQLMELKSMDIGLAQGFFTLRYFGTLCAVKAAAPRIRPGGSIVLSTGIAADRAGAGWSVGASICGAVESLTRALAVELAPIRVNAVSPGVVRTPLWARMPADEREQMYASVAGSIPVGRVGEPQDIAEAFLFLMNQGFATGSIITVDGGAVLV